MLNKDFIYRGMYGIAKFSIFLETSLIFQFSKKYIELPPFPRKIANFLWYCGILQNYHPHNISGYLVAFVLFFNPVVDLVGVFRGGRTPPDMAQHTPRKCSTPPRLFKLQLCKQAIASCRTFQYA